LTQEPCQIVRYSLDWWKAFIEIGSSVIGLGTGILAYRVYRANSRIEHAKWLVNLYEKFFERDLYKGMRDLLDCEEGDGEAAGKISKVVSEEPAEFTDYLNFFEMVAALADTRQISVEEILILFKYYLKCIKDREQVMEYLAKEKKVTKGSGNSWMRR
jgi:hypothetical protein